MEIVFEAATVTDSGRTGGIQICFSRIFTKNQVEPSYLIWLM